MHAGTNHEVIFKGREARMAASLLTEAGREDLAKSIDPPVETHRLGVLEFLITLKNKKNDNIEYSTPPEKASEILFALGRVAIPSNRSSEIFSEAHFIGSRMIEFISTVSEDAPYAVNVIPDIKY